MTNKLKMKKLIKFSFVAIIVFQFVFMAQFALADCSVKPGHTDADCTTDNLNTQATCITNPDCQWTSFGETPAQPAAAQPAAAQTNTANSLTLQVPIPTFNGGSATVKFNGTTGPIANYIKAIYTYAVSAVGIVAAVVLMIGGLMWITAGGNASNVSEAKAMITASLTGLVLVLASYLLLDQINPALINLGTETIIAPSVSQVATAISNGQSCPTDQTISCQACPNCVPAAAPGIGCKNSNSCEVTPTMASEIASLSAALSNNGGIPIQITEAWPPTVPHASKGHQDGDCVDLVPDSRTTDENTIEAIYSALKTAGFPTHNYECFSNDQSCSCSNYNIPSDNCGATETGSAAGGANHFHVCDY
jgi:hypothetical protein